MTARDQAKKAAETLDIGEQDGTADEPTDDASSERIPQGDETTAAGDDDAGEPSGFDRLFRTDRALDLNETVKFWDPRGDGGINRIGAALKQMGGWQYVAPAVWLMIGTLEVAYVVAVDHNLIPGRSASSTSADRDDRADDQEASATAAGGDPTAGGDPA